MEQVFQLFGDWLPTVVDPRKRLFAGYLLSALVIALLWLRYAQGLKLRDCWARIFARDAWWSASARADYGVAILNSVLMTLLAPRLLGHAAVAYAVFGGLHLLVDGRALIAAPGWAIAAGFTLSLFVVDDFARYWVHRLLHRIPLLWAFHKVHHGATALNPVTVMRTHPVEMLLFSLRSALVYGACIGSFFFFFGDQVTLLTVLGAGVFNFAFNLLGSNLRHSPVAIGFWKPLEKIFMSPAQHQVHHSTAPEHRDRNFGVALSLWDHCFGTLRHSEPDRKLEYGLGSGESAAHGLRSLYLAPFAEAAGILIKPHSKLNEVQL
ncbi:MAG: sterol desaturase family protein [Gammaproteobacteria bacterium]|jgi:sterol desaturase/sphingolipid hydroxylase (fatty acid hydroxylase superfamily)